MLELTYPMLYKIALRYNLSDCVPINKRVPLRCSVVASNSVLQAPASSQQEHVIALISNYIIAAV